MSRPLEVLLVEDDPGDVDLVREALQEGKLLVALHVAADGIQALQFLHREGPYANAPRPDLILLDLNMPRMNGRETLQRIKSEDNLKAIPVVILTTSEDEGDIKKTYGLGANCYIVKPMGLEGFIQLVNALRDFWFTFVKSPSR